MKDARESSQQLFAVSTSALSAMIQSSFALIKRKIVKSTSRVHFVSHPFDGFFLLQITFILLLVELAFANS